MLEQQVDVESAIRVVVLHIYRDHRAERLEPHFGMFQGCMAQKASARHNFP